MMKNKGWVRLWRDQFNSWISEKPFCDGYAWSYLYSQANHKKGMVNFRNEYIPIERGEFLTSKLQLQKKFGWTYRHVENFLKALENDKMVRNRTTNRYILITIINYEKYQGKDDKNDEQNEEQIRNRLRTGLERGNTNKNELKNIKNGKKVTSIYNHWNKKNIIIHKSIDPFISSIQIALKKYSEEDIKTAIENYSYILNSDKYFYKYRFTLNKFLTISAKTNHIEEFLDLKIAKNNYKGGNINGKSKRDNQKSDSAREDKYKHLEETYKI